MAALLKAIQYQTTIGLDSKSSGTGLMRLLVGVSGPLALNMGLLNYLKTMKYE